MTLLPELLGRAQTLGFLGPGPIEPHIDHAEKFAVVEAPSRALDLGSGGGLPALVLALRWPDSRWVLVDSHQRRTTFLVEATVALQLTDRVEVVTDRAERAARDQVFRGGFDLVTARSFGAPAVTAECGAGFLTVGGALVVSEPPEDDPARWPAAGLAELGLEDEGRQGAVRVLRSVVPVSDRYPRRVGVPTKRPLWRST